MKYQIRNFGFLVAVILLTYCVSFAEVFTISNDVNVPAQYSTLASALAAADDNDTLMIKGTSINYGTLYLNKPLTILGEGWAPNKDISKSPSFTIYFNSSNSANGSHIIGLNVHMATYSSGYTTHDITIERCRLTQLGITGNNWVVKHNFIAGRVDLYNASSNTLISNNVFSNTSAFISFSSTNQTNTIISNNVFFNNSVSYNFSANLNDAVVSNNIFYGRSLFNNSFSYVSFYNNLVYDAPVNVFPNDAPNNVISTNNFELLSTSQADSLVIYESDTIDTDEDCSLYFDLHLKNTSFYVDKGSDGNPLGIYGGADPWPESEPNIPYQIRPVPPIPLVQRMRILNTPSKDGTLQVEIKAKTVK